MIVSGQTRFCLHAAFDDSGLDSDVEWSLVEADIASNLKGLGPAIRLLSGVRERRFARAVAVLSSIAAEPITEFVHAVIGSSALGIWLRTIASAKARCALGDR